MPRQVDDATAREIVEHNRRLHEDARYAADYDRSCGILAHPWERRVFRRDVEAICALLARGKGDILLFRREKVECPLLHVLDVGCGTGSLTLLFLERGFAAIGLDLAQAMLDQLQAKARERGFASRLRTEAAEADAFLAATPDAFDVIAFSAILHHLPDYVATVRLAASKLRPGGVLYIIHEPSLGARVGRVARALERLDKGLAELPAFLRRQWRDCRQRGLWAALAAKLRRRPRTQQAPGVPDAADWTLVDYHAKHGGCDEEALAAALREAGLTVDLRRYDSKRHRLLHHLARLLHTKRMIRIVAQRPLL